MYEYDDICIRIFLEQQKKLFPQTVAETPEEAADFLEMCMAAVCRDIREAREYLKELGMDVSGMTKEELIHAAEVFALPDGRYLVVEG